MTRPTVRVELGRFSATMYGSGIREALKIADARWMPHPYRGHRAGVFQVHHEDANDVLTALELAGLHVEVVDRDGRPVPYGGLLGGAA